MLNKKLIILTIPIKNQKKDNKKNFFYILLINN